MLNDTESARTLEVRQWKELTVYVTQRVGVISIPFELLFRFLEPVTTEDDLCKLSSASSGCWPLFFSSAGGGYTKVTTFPCSLVLFEKLSASDDLFLPSDQPCSLLRWMAETHGGFIMRIDQTMVSQGIGEIP